MDNKFFNHQKDKYKEKNLTHKQPAVSNISNATSASGGVDEGLLQ